MATRTLTGDNGENNITSFDVATNDDHSIVHALGGNDVVEIFFGTFEVHAGEGDDRVQTGGIGGSAFGEGGNDVLASPNGGFEVYELHGGEGDDVLFAGRSTTRS